MMTEQVLHAASDKFLSSKFSSIKQPKSPSQSKKFSALIKPVKSSHSFCMTKNHSISSSNIKQYQSLNENSINQGCPLTVIKKLDEMGKNKQRGLDNLFKERQNRQQVYKFFNEQRQKMIQKERQFGYLLPKIGFRRGRNSNEKLENIESEKNNKSKQKISKLSKQQKQLSPQVMSYRKRCEIQLQKMKLSLPKFLEKKQRFYDLEEDFVKDLQSQYKEQMENGSKIEKQELIMTQNKFYLIKGTGPKQLKIQTEHKDSTIPEFLMERLSAGSPQSLKKFSFFTEIDQQHSQSVIQPKKYMKDLKKDIKKKELR